MACSIDLTELKIKLQRFSFVSSAFMKAWWTVNRYMDSNHITHDKAQKLAEPIRYGYKNYALTGFAAMYADLYSEDDEEETKERRGKLHEAASTLLPETFLNHIFKGLLGINEKYDFLNLRELDDDVPENAGEYVKLLHKYKSIQAKSKSAMEVDNFASELGTLLRAEKVEEEHLKEASHFFTAYELVKADSSKLPELAEELFRKLKSDPSYGYLYPARENFEYIFVPELERPFFFSVKKSASEDKENLDPQERSLLNSVAALNALVEYEYRSLPFVKNSNYASVPLIYGEAKFSEPHESFEEGQQYKDPELARELKQMFEHFALSTSKIESGKEAEKLYKKHLQNFKIISSPTMDPKDYFVHSVVEWIDGSLGYSPLFKAVKEMYENIDIDSNIIYKSIFLPIEYEVLNVHRNTGNYTGKKYIARIWAAEQLFNGMLKGAFKDEPVFIPPENMRTFNEKLEKSLGLTLSEESRLRLKTVWGRTIAPSYTKGIQIPSILQVKDRKQLYEKPYYKLLLALGEELKDYNLYLDTVSIRFNQSVYYTLMKISHTIFALKAMENVQDSQSYVKWVNYNQDYEIDLESIFKFAKETLFGDKIAVYVLGARSMRGDIEFKDLTDKDRYEFVLRSFFTFRPSIYVLYPPGDKKFNLAVQAKSGFSWTKDFYSFLLPMLTGWLMNEHSIEISKTNVLLKKALKLYFDAEKTKEKIDALKKEAIDHPLPLYPMTSVEYVLKKTEEKDGLLDYVELFQRYATDISNGAAFFYKFPALNSTYLHTLYADNPEMKIFGYLTMDEKFSDIIRTSVEKGPDSPETTEKIKEFFDPENFQTDSGTYRFPTIGSDPMRLFANDFVLPFFIKEAEESYKILDTLGVANNKNSILNEDVMDEFHKGRIHSMIKDMGRQMPFKKAAILYLNLHYFVVHTILGRYVSVDPASCAKTVKYTLPKGSQAGFKEEGERISEFSKKERNRIKKTLLEAYHTLAKRSGVFSGNGYIFFPEDVNYFDNATGDFLEPNTPYDVSRETRLFFYNAPYENALSEVFGFPMDTMKMIYPTTFEKIDDPKAEGPDIDAIVEGRKLDERIETIEKTIKSEIERLKSLPTPIEFYVDSLPREMEKLRTLGKERTFLANYIETYLKEYPLTDGANFVTPHEYLAVRNSHDSLSIEQREALEAYCKIRFLDTDTEEDIRQKFERISSLREDLVRLGVRVNGLKMLGAGMLDFNGTKGSLTIKSAQHRLPLLGPKSFLGFLNNNIMENELQGIISSSEELKTLKPRSYAYVDPSKPDKEQYPHFYTVPRYLVKLQHDLPHDSTKSKIGIQLLKLLFQDLSSRSQKFDFPDYLTLASKDFFGLDPKKGNFTATEFMDAARRIIKGQLFGRIEKARKEFELDKLEQLFVSEEATDEEKTVIVKTLVDTVVKKGAETSINTGALSPDVFTYLETTEKGFLDIPVYSMPGGENVVTAFFGNLMKRLTVHRVNGGEFTELPVVAAMMYDQDKKDWVFDPIFSRSVIKTGMTDWDGVRPLKDVGLEVVDGKRRMRQCEIIVTWNFRNPDGSLMDINEFLDGNGNIDLTRVDPVLLQGMFYRTPTQNTSFITSYVIVGFIPPPEGLYVLHPPSHQARYGMDYDADVLRFLNYHHKKVVEYVGTKIKTKRSRLVLDDSSERKRLDNAFIDFWRIKMTFTPALFEGANEYLMEDVYKEVPKEGLMVKFSHVAGNPIAQVVQNNELLVGKANIGITVSMASLFYHLYANEIEMKKPLNPEPKLVLEWGTIKHTTKLAVDYTYNGEYVPAIINTFVSLMVDNAKNNHAGINNINVHTLSFMVYATLTGYSFKDVVFIARSFIGRMFTDYSSRQGNVMIKERPEENFPSFVKNRIEQRLKSLGIDRPDFFSSLDRYIMPEKKTDEKKKKDVDKVKPTFRMNLVYENGTLYEDFSTVDLRDKDDDYFYRVLDAAKWLETINAEGVKIKNVNSRIFRAPLRKITSNLPVMLDSLEKWHALADMVENPENEAGYPKSVDGVSLAQYKGITDAVRKDSEFMELNDIFKTLTNLMSVNGQILPDDTTLKNYSNTIKNLKKIYKIPFSKLESVFDMVKSRQFAVRYLVNFADEKTSLEQLYEREVENLLFDQEPLSDLDDKDNLSKERLNKLSIVSLYDLIWERYASKATKNIYFISIRRSSSGLPLFLSVSTTHMDYYGMEGIQSQFMHLFEGRWTENEGTDKKDATEAALLETFVNKLLSYTVLLKNHETAKSSFVRTIPSKVLKTFVTQGKPLEFPLPSVPDLTLTYFFNFPDSIFPLSVEQAYLDWGDVYDISKKQIKDATPFSATVEEEFDDKFKNYVVYSVVEFEKGKYSIYSITQEKDYEAKKIRKTLKFETRALTKKILMPFVTSDAFVKKINGTQETEEDLMESQAYEKDRKTEPENFLEGDDSLSEYFVYSNIEDIENPDFYSRECQ